MYQKAINLITKYHSDQVDKGGNAYINHLYCVSDSCEDEHAKLVGLLHDILEDTSCTPQELKDNGFSSEIVEAIITLSKNYSTSYDQYLKNIKDNKIAREVKIADLKNNMDLSRLKDIKDKDIKRNEKYKESLLFLEN